MRRRKPRGPSIPLWAVYIADHRRPTCDIKNWIQDMEKYYMCYTGGILKPKDKRLESCIELMSGNAARLRSHKKNEAGKETYKWCRFIGSVVLFNWVKG